MGEMTEKDIIFILCGLLVGASVIAVAVLVAWDTYIKRKKPPKHNWREG